MSEKETLPRLTYEDRQALKDLEDPFIDVLLILDSTMDTIKSLVSAHTNYSRCCRTGSDEVEFDDSDLIAIALKEQLQEVASHRKQVQALHQKVQGMIQLVRALHFCYLTMLIIKGVAVKPT